MYAANSSNTDVVKYYFSMNRINVSTQLSSIKKKMIFFLVLPSHRVIYTAFYTRLPAQTFVWQHTTGETSKKSKKKFSEHGIKENK